MSPTPGINSSSSSPDLPGLQQSIRLMWGYESRQRTLRHLGETDFLSRPEIRSVHVDNTRRADRAILTGFDATGQAIAGDTVYFELAHDHFDTTAEFDHAFTQMPVPNGSELHLAIEREYGWVVDLEEVRSYDTYSDQELTQRQIVMVNLSDMIAHGAASGFFLGQDEAAQESAPRELQAEHTTSDTITDLPHSEPLPEALDEGAATSGEP